MKLPPLVLSENTEPDASARVHAAGHAHGKGRAHQVRRPCCLAQAPGRTQGQQAAAALGLQSRQLAQWRVKVAAEDQGHPVLLFAFDQGVLQARRIGATGLHDGEPARVSSRTGAVSLPVELTDEIMPGVVSIPHGWGHDQDGSELAVAAAHAGANSNLLADEETRDRILDHDVLYQAVLERAGCLAISEHLYFYVLVRRT